MYRNLGQLWHWPHTGLRIQFIASLFTANSKLPAGLNVSADGCLSCCVCPAMNLYFSWVHHNKKLGSTPPECIRNTGWMETWVEEISYHILIVKAHSNTTCLVAHQFQWWPPLKIARRSNVQPHTWGFVLCDVLENGGSKACSESPVMWGLWLWR